MSETTKQSKPRASTADPAEAARAIAESYDAKRTRLFWVAGHEFKTRDGSIRKEDLQADAWLWLDQRYSHVKRSHVNEAMFALRAICNAAARES